MTELERLERILRELAPILPDGRWVLSGSAVLYLNGVQHGRPMGDLDIFVATRTWFNLLDLSDSGLGPHMDVTTPNPDDPKRRCDPPYLEFRMYGLEINIFSSWRVRHIGDMDPNFMIHNARPVRGWPCVPLMLLLDYKSAWGRDKDMTDIYAIRKFLGLETPGLA